MDIKSIPKTTAQTRNAVFMPLLLSRSASFPTDYRPLFDDDFIIPHPGALRKRAAVPLAQGAGLFHFPCSKRSMSAIKLTSGQTVPTPTKKDGKNQ
jgi:hypothetical protein